jgi:hypothetical protein
MNKTILLLVPACAALCAGCETESPHFDSQIGQASRHLIEAQTLDPGTAGNPPELAPAGADGQRLKSAIDNYHKDVNRPEQSVARPIVFEVGKQQGQ